MAVAAKGTTKPTPQSSAQPPSNGGGKPEGGIVGPLRIKGIFMSPPATLGYSHLLKPDEYLGKTKFKLKAHLTQAAIDKFAADIQAKFIVPYAADLRKLSPKKALKDRSAAVWLSEKLTQPVEASRIQLPSMNFDCNASYENKQGETIHTSVKAWSPANELLDLKTLRLGMGSIIQVGFNASLWAGGLNKYYIEPSLRLVGVRVLKAEHYGAGGGGLTEDVSQDDLALLEEGFEMEDLSQFALGSGTSKADQQVKAEEQPAGQGEGDLEDEIPF